MELGTKRLILTPCTEQSLSTYNAREYSIRPHIATYLERLKEDCSLLGWGVWLVIDKNTNRVVGDIGFKGKPDKEETVEVGYGIISSEQNKGYATEALKRLVDWAFVSKFVAKIMAECEEDNLASINVLRKLNMKKTSHNKGMLYWQLTNDYSGS
ncbi:GNAT family N-acetyltransferase [Ornithinibacillus scapharcae]|uniref:GNAT family N-acetyltransferase n=1 Tax=Ornithinibacillus scapharcae TaxID=1147159 RepID=UPI000225BA16|nr:GNAT family N-acetyltransferase [Ornithinibacillus scapharcae]